MNDGGMMGLGSGVEGDGAVAGGSWWEGMGVGGWGGVGELCRAFDDEIGIGEVGRFLSDWIFVCCFG